MTLLVVQKQKMENIVIAAQDTYTIDCTANMIYYSQCMQLSYGESWQLSTRVVPKQVICVGTLHQHLVPD